MSENNNIRDVINKYKSQDISNNKQIMTNDIPKFKNENLPKSAYTETDPDLVVGYEMVSLPSKGINKYNGVGFDEFKVEYLTSQDEDILTTPSLIENGTVLDKILEVKIKENVSIDELFYGDKNALTLFLRASSYGHEYDVDVYDPRTGIPFKYTIDLRKFKHKKVTELPDQNGLYAVDLEIRKKTVQFRLLTSGEEKSLYKKAEAIKEAYGSEISTFNSLKLKSNIVSVDGNTNRDYINKFIDALPLKDTYTIRKKIYEVTPDIDSTYEFTTKDGYKFTSTVSFNVDFFFPKL